MNTTLRCALVALLSFYTCISSSAQVQVGSYPFETTDAKGFDTVNIGNLNVHFNLPIVSKPGRGLPFVYSLGYDSSVWYPSTASGTYAWTPTQSYGWLGDTATLTGYVWYSVDAEYCFYHGLEGYSYTYTDFRYIDPFGVPHLFLGGTVDNTECGGSSTTSFSRTAHDGSGYTISVTGYTAATITGRTGELIQPPYFGATGLGSLTDTNGNYISSDGSGTFVDTLGTNAVVVAGGAPSNETFTYMDSTGASQTVTLAYESATVQTNFGCSGIGEFGPTAQYLVHTITYPDGEAYTIDYEPTPGASSNVTGRIAKITLPTGGRISYSYSGGSNGINCADGSTAVLTRTLNDDVPAVSSWTYTSSAPGGSGTTHTQVLDGNGNYAEYDFVQYNGAPYETLRNIYQTSELVTPNVQKATCYNASPEPCTTTAISAAISQLDTYNTLDGTQENGITQYFNSSGMLTEEDDYDFGPSSRGSELQKTTTNYSGLNLPSSTLVYDGSGHTLSETAYSYDVYSLTATSGLPQHVSVGSTRGNLSYVSLANSGSWITQASYYYDDAGQVLTSQDSNFNSTTYTYDSGTDGFVTGVSMPSTGGGAHLTSSTYDIGSGVKLTDVDQNGNTTTYTYDSMLRPSCVVTPGGGSQCFTYSLTPTSPWTGVSTLQGGTSWPIVATYYDPYGRPNIVGWTDTPSAAAVIYAYDANGNRNSVSNPLRSGDPFYYTFTSFDSLGRPGQITDSDGVSVKNYTYAGNSTTFTDEAGHQRKIVFDGLGRISQAWEPYPTSTTLALETDYAYNQYQSSSGYFQDIVTQKGGPTTSSSDWRVRTFTQDLLGRTVSASTPEAGTITYTYPTGYGSCAGIVSLACTRTDANGTSTTYSYDALNREIGKTYGGSSIGTGTASVAYYYDQTSYNGLTISNGTGLRTGMSDGSGSTAWSYDTAGDVGAVRKTINSVTKQANYTYNVDHTVNTVQDFGGTTFTYSYNAAERPTSIVDGSSDSYASAALYNAAGQLTSLNHQLTSGGASYVRSLQYNSRLQPSVISATLGGSTIQSLSYGYGTGGTNNGNILQIVNGMDSSRSQTYAYDNLNRLASGQDVSHWGETYTYDNWGNLYQTQQIPGLGGNNWSVGAPGSNNQLSNLSYDLAGEVTEDQFTNTYAYDAEGRILTGGSGSYVYDGDGNRVEKTASSVTTLYWPGTSGALDESNGSGSSMGKQVQFAGLLVWHEDTSGSGNFLFHDHLGSIRITGDPSGTLHDDNDYQSFGNLWNNYGASPSDNHYLFAGYESDASESNTDYATFRNLGTILGRFNRPDPYDGSYDPANPQSLNRYSYVMNMPLSLVDDSGLDAGLYGQPFTDNQGCLRSGYDESILTCFGFLGFGGGVRSNLPTQTYLGVDGPGGGGGRGGGTPSPSDPCANATLAATGVNPQQNTAQANKWTATGALIGALYGDPLTGALVGYGSLVGPGGPQDVKNQPGPGTSQQRVAAGNISYGITCPFGAGFCQFAAGFAQTLAGDPDPNGTLNTGYDTPSDNASIRQGQAMRAAGCPR